MSNRIDILIKNGTIIDPGAGKFEIGDIAIKDGRIAAYDETKYYEVKNTIEATGYLVTPGLIDNHVHIYAGGTESGFYPDIALLPMGVTTAIDAGSSGYGNCENFRKNIVDNSLMHIYYLLNVSPAGQISESYSENVDPILYDEEKFLQILKADRQHIKGLKLRFGKEVVNKFGISALEKSINLAEKLRCPITVHVTNPPCDLSYIAALMRIGDTICHCYHGKGSTILDENGYVKKAVLAARKRGVLFDTADARSNHSYSVIKKALEDGFKPDIISTDLTQASMFGNMCFGLPVVLSKYLNLGLTLEEVIKACTWTPAVKHGLNDRIGSLEEGKNADVSIFKLVDEPFKLTNFSGESFQGSQLLVPNMTIFKGKIMFRQVTFPM